MMFILLVVVLQNYYIYILYTSSKRKIGERERAGVRLHASSTPTQQLMVHLPRGRGGSKGG